MEIDYFFEKRFEKKDFTNGTLKKGEYECCSFRNCNFSNFDLSGIRFLTCEFFDCDLSNAKLFDTSFQETLFKDCKLLGLQFENCNNFAFSIKIDHCILNHSSFYHMKLQRSSFEKSQLHGVDFTESEMNNILFTNCDLLDATFDKTNLEKTDFRNSINYSIDPESNRIKGAKFSLPQAISLLDKYLLDIDQ